MWAFRCSGGRKCGRGNAASRPAARYLEALVILWVSLAFGEGPGANFAFKIIRR